MNRTCNLLLGIVLTVLLAGVLTGCAGPVKTEKQLQNATENMQKIIQSKLQNLNNAMSDAAVKIAKSGLGGEETRGILNNLAKKYPYVIDWNTADPGGKLVTVVPDAYRKYEGTETAVNEESRKSLQELITNKKPSLSKVFRAVEGVDAVVLLWPIVSEKGEYLGNIAALFKPADLMAETIGPAAKVRAMEVDVTQTDGRTIYSTEASEDNTNILTDPQFKQYPELVAIATKMAAEKTGSAKYTYLSHATGKEVKKTAFWITLGVNGTEWRMLGVAELGN